MDEHTLLHHRDLWVPENPQYRAAGASIADS